MDKRMQQISQAIRSGKALEENISRLFNHLADHYQANSAIQLAMLYFSYYEAYYDDENTWSEDAKSLITRLNILIRDQLFDHRSGAEREKAILEADQIRREIMKRMECLTVYTDIFQVYEYVLNRLEYRFEEKDIVIDDEEFSKEILRFIFDSEDNVIINEKIKEIIGQLPIRITKHKYFELLRNSLRVYLGSEQASLDSYLYMLRSSAMLSAGQDMESLYPNLWEKKEALSQIKYSDISEDIYHKAVNQLQAASFILETESYVYYGLQEIINMVYTLLLCSPYTDMTVGKEEGAIETAFEIIRDINHIFTGGEKPEPDNSTVEKLSALEGVIEELTMDASELEDVLYLVEQKYEALTESLMLKEYMNVLLRIRKLMSSSPFALLEEEARKAIVDEKIIEKETASLENELADLFAAQDRMINRAVMANTINKLPVFFDNHKEVMDYVLYSLTRCSDSYEKAACAEIINAIMTE